MAQGRRAGVHARLQRCDVLRAPGQLVLGGLQLALRDAHQRHLLLVRAPRLRLELLLLLVRGCQLRLQLLDRRLHAQAPALLSMCVWPQSVQCIVACAAAAGACSAQPSRS
jgi:hypothetical protein